MENSTNSHVQNSKFHPTTISREEHIDESHGEQAVSHVRLKRQRIDLDSAREYINPDKITTLPPIGHINSPNRGREKDSSAELGEIITDLSSKGTDSPRILSRHNSRQDIDSPRVLSRHNSRHDIDLVTSIGTLNMNSSPPTLKNHKLGSLSHSSTPTCSPRIKRRALERANSHGSNGSCEILYRKAGNLLTQHVTAKVDSGLFRRARNQSPASSPRILRRSQDVQSLINADLADRQRSSSFSGCTSKGNQASRKLKHSLSHDMANQGDNAERLGESPRKFISGNGSSSPPMIEDYLVSTMSLNNQNEAKPNQQDVVEIDFRTFAKCHTWLREVEKAHEESMSLDDVTLPPVQWKESDN